MFGESYINIVVGSQKPKWLDAQLFSNLRVDHLPFYLVKISLMVEFYLEIFNILRSLWDFLMSFFNFKHDCLKNKPKFET